MPWANETRFRRAKVVQHTEDPNRFRIAASVAAMHYESEIDSGIFDAEVNLRPSRVQTAALNGWRITSNGWHFAYQGFPAVGSQPPQGTIGFGGRRGQHWLTLRPTRIGYIDWRDRSFDPIGGAPQFGTPVLLDQSHQIGIDDDDPNVWTLRNGFTIDVADIWTTPNGGSVRWQMRGSGGQLKQDFVINQAARQWIANNRPPTTPATDTYFVIAFRMDFSGIPRLDLGGTDRSKAGDDFEVLDNLVMRDVVGRRLAHFGFGDIYVPGRGGTVPIKKRIFFNGTDWWFVIGANVAQMNQNLLPGDLVIDPPISEEDITVNSDDAMQNYNSAGNMSLSGNNNQVYVGDYARQYHMGFRFQSVPIANGATINSATLEPRATGTGATTGITFRVYCEDIDDAPTFTTTANNLTGRTRTTAFFGGTATDLPAANNRAAWDVSGPLDELVNRAGWANNNDLAFLVITQSNNNNYWGFNDYNGGAANAADFNADVTTGGGGGLAIPIVQAHARRRR